MAADRPLVSIGMPLYNAAGKLERSLALIRNQTYDNLDIILSDNASTDATPEICAAAAREDSRIRYVRNAENIGPIANFNAARRLKRGELFAWAAHDDEKAPEFIAETVAALLANPNAVMSCTHATLITREGESLLRPYSEAIASPLVEERVGSFVRETHVGIPFYGLFRSAALDALGDVDPWLDTDRRYLFRAVLRGPFVVVPKVLFRFRLFRSADDYVAMGFKMRPGAADFDLDLYRHFADLISEAGFDPATERRAVRSMRDALATYLDNRATYLISRLLADGASRGAKARRLVAYARQYPPLAQKRIFWGALRRVLAA